jgi:ABC-type lipoprotein release transport system permease subunit
VFLALLALGAVGHALATAVHRRRLDTAVLRTLGMTRPQVRAMIAAQATTLAVVAVVLGVPLGLILGRRLWHIVANNTPVQYVPPFTPLVLVFVIALSVLAVNILAAYPAHRAVRQRISTLLRSE